MTEKDNLDYSSIIDKYDTDIVSDNNNFIKNYIK